MQRIYDFCRLVHSLVQDINSLEEEIVRWRQALIKYLPPQETEGLRSDIFSNLAGNNAADEAYHIILDGSATVMIQWKMMNMLIGCSVFVMRQMIQH